MSEKLLSDPNLEPNELPDIQGDLSAFNITPFGTDGASLESGMVTSEYISSESVITSDDTEGQTCVGTCGGTCSTCFSTCGNGGTCSTCYSTCDGCS